MDSWCCGSRHIVADSGTCCHVGTWMAMRLAIFRKVPATMVLVRCDQGGISGHQGGDMRVNCPSFETICLDWLDPR